MGAKKDKTVELLTPPCAHGHATALVTDGDESFITPIKRVIEGEALQPGDTIMTTEAIEGDPARRRVISEYVHEGPSRAATPKYRKNYDAMNWN